MPLVTGSSSFEKGKIFHWSKKKIQRKNKERRKRSLKQGGGKMEANKSIRVRGMGGEQSTESSQTSKTQTVDVRRKPKGGGPLETT